MVSDSTDHKPLISLLGYKQLDELTLRIQHFCMRLMSYYYSISHVPGKEFDALSCAPVSNFRADDSELEQETTAFAQRVLQSIYQYLRSDSKR